MARIVVVDDAAFMRRVLRDMLVAAGHEVVGEAANGIEAVNCYQELRPELTTRLTSPCPRRMDSRRSARSW